MNDGAVDEVAAPPPTVNCDVAWIVYDGGSRPGGLHGVFSLLCSAVLSLRLEDGTVWTVLGGAPIRRPPTRSDFP